MGNLRKKNHIIECNLRLEKKYLTEQEIITNPQNTETPKSQEKQKSLQVFSDLIETIKNDHPERARACRKLYDSVQYGDINKVKRFADKCLESLPNKDRTDYTSKMLLFSKQQSDLLKSPSQRTNIDKIQTSTNIASSLLLLWTSIKQAFQKERQEQNF
jgi:hypothetical protein